MAAVVPQGRPLHLHRRRRLPRLHHRPRDLQVHPLRPPLRPLRGQAPILALPQPHRGRRLLRELRPRLRLHLHRQAEEEGQGLGRRGVGRRRERGRGGREEGRRGQQRRLDVQEELDGQGLRDGGQERHGRSGGRLNLRITQPITLFDKCEGRLAPFVYVIRVLFAVRAGFVAGF